MHLTSSLRPLATQFALALLVAAPHAAAAARPPRCPAGMIAVEGGVLQAPERPRATVRTFCIDKTEVTVDAWASCVAAGACAAAELQCGNAATWGKKGLGNHPINCVTWEEADTFCREHGKRLPTEFEWEWAARGGDRALPFPWGDDAPGSRVCWDGDGNSEGAGKRKATCPVGSHPKSRSADGVEDLAGNVREWTSTEHDRHRVIRGGSWGDSMPGFLAVDFRGWNAPDERIELTGFRCAAPLGAIARRPVKKAAPRQGVRATVDDTGVMVFDDPMNLDGRREKRRR